MSLAAWTLALLLSAATAFAQSLDDQARALKPANSRPLSEAVLDDLESRAAAALAKIHHASNKLEADRARRELRPKLEASLGVARLPWPPDLRPQHTGTVIRPGYRIEKLIFQTVPGVYTTAHLYLPEKTSQPVPAILFYNGHWWPDSKTRPDFQAFCINMARWGVAVLSFDAFGQGERGISSRDHRRTELLLGGVSQQGIAEYETRCALEYLTHRKEVDPKRIGMTGASGGGYNTWMTAALDDRIQVAVPVVGTSDFQEQIHVTRPLDWYHATEHCHFVPGLITYANNHEFVAAVAPRPLMIIAASVDQSFPINGVRAIQSYARGLYRQLDIEDKFGYFEDAAEGHGYQQAKREAAYGFLLRWLAGKGDGKPIPEPPTKTEPYDSAELKCAPARQPAGPGLVAMAKQLAKPAAESASQNWLGPDLPEANLLVQLQPKQIQRTLFETQPGIRVPAIVVRPQTAQEAGVLIAIHDQGKEELASDPVIREALRRHWMVWAIDPRGIGELNVERGWVFAVSLLLGENFVWRQAADIRRIATAAARVSKKTAIYARGPNAALAATYALQTPGLQWAVLRDGFLTFQHFIDRPKSLPASYRLLDEDIREQRKTAFDREIPHKFFVFDQAHQLDIGQRLANRHVTVIDPINGDAEKLTPPQVRAVLPPSIALATEQHFLKSAW